ncbi:hypothetical protein IAQ61_002242, partial [Plenodomus lingam]|uniref:Predicted protein n=1 Tax=Leptosphaeria maculans (strain JN3 / isolate v23.1.3 / race Av1-4-5-6-7-8) TaxID=985895 RepID=E4ZI97_LEPMJ
MAGEYVVERKCMQSDSSRMSKSNKRARTECEITAKGNRGQLENPETSNKSNTPNRSSRHSCPRASRLTPKCIKGSSSSSSNSSNSNSNKASWTIGVSILLQLTARAFPLIGQYPVLRDPALNHGRRITPTTRALHAVVSRAP